MKRDSFIVYKSFYAIIKLLKPRERLKMFEAIFEYGFNETNPNFSDDVSKAIWDTIIPQLKANQRRYENGLKGGAPVGNSNAKKNNQDSEEKTTENQPTIAEENNQDAFEKTTKKQPNENVNENENENVVSKKESKEKNIFKKELTTHTRESYDDVLDECGIDNDLLREAVFRFIGHLKANGITIINDRLYRLIVALDRSYGTDIDKIKAIDAAIIGGYKRLECEGY